MIHHIISRPRSQRRFAPNTLRPRVDNPLALGQIPGGLSNPLGSISEPGRTIWKFDGSPRNLNFGGGAIITTARLVPLFWGEFWRTATNPSVNDIHQAIAQILPSPYLSEAMQYGFKSLTLEPAVIVISPGPPFPSFSGDDVQNMVWDLIDDDRFPEPDKDGGRIVYMVFAPQGSSYKVTGAGGAHTEARDIDVLDVDYAWVGWCDYNAGDGFTEIFTHELVEILTDPEPPGGWTVNGFPEGNNEIADCCFHQTGMVSGYRVTAYYSDRLKACVVPTFPNQFSISVVVTKEEGFGPGIQSEGVVATTKLTSCFSGSYDFTDFGQARRVTMTAAVTGYVEPEFSWTVEGTAVPNSASLGTPIVTITTSAANVLDPVSSITTLPPRTITARAAASANALILESGPGEAPGVFEIHCKVEEKNLPSGYHTGREDLQSVIVTGRARVMDERFQKDLANCIHLKSVLAKALMKEVVIPAIDLGDPPPPWVERALSEIEVELDQNAHNARFLAHFVEAADPELAATLRHLAGGTIAQSHATTIVVVAEADRSASIVVES